MVPSKRAGSEQGLWKGSFGTVLEVVPPAWAAPGLLLLGLALVTCVCLSGCMLGSILASVWMLGAVGTGSEAFPAPGQLSAWHLTLV